MYGRGVSVEQVWSLLGWCRGRVVGCFYLRRSKAPAVMAVKMSWKVVTSLMLATWSCVSLAILVGE